MVGAEWAMPRFYETHSANPMPPVHWWRCRRKLDYNVEEGCLYASYFNVRESLPHRTAEIGVAMMIKVTDVKALEDHKLQLSFNTGETKVFDVGPYLNKGIFTELRDPSYFRSVRLAFGSIAWPNDQDFGPESLNVESCPLTD
jgi:hypothetical protein